MQALPMEKAVPMTPEESKMFLSSCFADKEHPEPMTRETLEAIAGKDLPFPFALALKRIEVLQLPIQFTTGAFFLFGIMPDRAGAVVVMLIDLLEEFEGQLVTTEMVAQKYPYGFYKEEALCERADFLKADRGLDPDKRKSKFSYIY